MYCKYCGAENKDGSAFCYKCGKSLRDEAGRTAADDKSRLKRKLSTTRIIALAVIGIVLISIIPIGISVIREKGKYSEIIAKADKCCELENYTDAIRYYTEALDMDDGRKEAYIGLSNVYRAQADFDESYSYLEQGTGQGLELSSYMQELDLYQDQFEFIYQLSSYVENGDYEEALNMLNSEYIPESSSDCTDAIYFNNNKIENKITEAEHMAVYCPEEGIYVGEWSGGKRNGYGIQFGKQGGSYYYFDGIWTDNEANGNGTLYVSKANAGGVYDMQYSGNYTDGKMNGTINVQWIPTDGESEYGEDTVQVTDGAFSAVRMTDSGGYVYLEDGDTYWYFENEESLKTKGDILHSYFEVHVSDYTSGEK